MRAFALLIGVLSFACGGGGGRPSGPPVPVVDTTRVVQGVVAYFPTGPDLTQRDANGRLLAQPGFAVPHFPRPAPRVPVQIFDDQGVLLADTETGADGSYSITVNFGKRPATRVVVRADSFMRLPFGTVVRVIPAEGGQPYHRETPPSGDPDSTTMNVDLHIPLDEEAPAYHILDSLYEGFILAKSGIPVHMPDLDVIWAHGNGDASSFQVVNNRPQIVVAGGAPGDPASNRDCWDSPKLMRLQGEYLVNYFFHTAPPEGEPNEALLVPTAAWQEGFLDWWACQGRGSREYWDTEGIGEHARVVRFFDCESFFDASLGSLGPDDPNVYQDASVVGIGSRFTVAEFLWDLHDANGTGTDKDAQQFPLFLTLRSLRNALPGQSYPYLITLLDEIVSDLSLAPSAVQFLLSSPEDQDVQFPAPVGTDDRWPPAFQNPAAPGAPIEPGFDGTLSDEIDTQNPVPVNYDIGFQSQRYFLIDLARPAQAMIELTSASPDLSIQLLDLNNIVLASGGPVLVVPSLPAGRYVVRVITDMDPLVAPFTVHVVLSEP